MDAMGFIKKTKLYLIWPDGMLKSPFQFLISPGFFLLAKGQETWPYEATNLKWNPQWEHPSSR